MNKTTTKLAGVFDERASILDSKLAVKDRDYDWSYTELLSHSEDFSGCLSSLGVSNGDRVVLMLPNSGAFVAAFFGIARVGGIVAPLNIRYQEQELMFYIKDASPSVVVVIPEAAERTQKVLKQIKPSPSLISMKPDGGFQILQKGEVYTTAIALEKGQPILHQYTSGSTGNPKRVIRTHEQLFRELVSLADVFKLTERDRFLGAAPFSHVNGLVRTMMTSMFVGGTLYPVPQFNRREVIKIITQEKITYFGSVPYMYIILAATPISGDADLSSIRIAFSSSAPLLADDNRQFAAKYGFFIRQLYGSTETGSISVNTDQEVDKCMESVGFPLDGISAKILDDKGKTCPTGQHGEIAICSPFAITGYDNNPEANVKNFKNGYYLTGDLGFIDEKGYLTLTGRKKFLINRGGYEINPHEVEKAILTHRKVREAVVLAKPSAHGDQKVRCVIVANPPCTADDIIEHCKARVADYKVPSIIEFVTELPKSPTGKILRDKLK